MECDVTKNGTTFRRAPTAPRAGGVKRKLLSGGVGCVRLDLSAALPGAALSQQVNNCLSVNNHQDLSKNTSNNEPPFMNNMDEISYWIFTKRAPCLMNYDIVNKKQVTTTDDKIESIHSSGEESSPKKRKKRKLSILDDETVSGKQQNVYFEAPQQAHKTRVSSSKSDTLVSDVDFNIKNSSIQEKPKRLKTQKNSLTAVHKKNKLVTSTPKVNNGLRRSLRKQNIYNNNSQRNISYETNFLFVNKQKQNCIENIGNKKSNSGVGKKAACDLNKRFESNERIQKTDVNRQFEDMSDVSGFTANYIRSTKIQNTRTPRNLRNKNNRNLVKESQQNLKTDDNKMVVCFSKAMNTNDPTKTAVLNCSTDSSQNILNLITVHEHEKGHRINKSTSLLKFMESKPSRNKKGEGNLKQNSINKQHNTTLDTSFNSNGSRYPKRYRNGPRGDTANVTIADSKTTQTRQSTPNKGSRQKVAKQPSLILNLDLKEDPESSLSRTRSGRSVGIAVHRPVNSILVLSNCTEPSSNPVVNVAQTSEQQQPDDITRRKRNSGVRFLNHSKKSLDKSQSLRRDSLRDKSGFAACFSDSDDNDEPLKTRKFFC